MCGIAGLRKLQDSASPTEDLLWRMGDVMAHRGPNNKGIFINGSSGLSYRRLSIIDTNEQDQPILHNEDKSLRIAFNGEIYNFPELRRFLEEKGHRFYTGTDTEMILHLYEEEGEECVKRLNGIFTFAIMDLRNDSLFLARDQMGVKPLYYLQTPEYWAFASEIKSLLIIPGVQKKVNPEALDLYLRYRFVPDPLTMFDGIFKLPPGHSLFFKDTEMKVSRYFDLRDTYLDAPTWTSREQTADAIRSTVSEAVRAQMLADVPVGAFLSGGIDSSIVVGLMAQHSKTPLKTFSIGFTEENYNELRYAKEVSRHFGTEHFETILRPEHITALPDVVWSLDEPLADPAAIPTYFLSKQAREQVTVVLAGEGGDELFAGYKEDFGYMDMPLKVLPSDVRRAGAEMLMSMGTYTGQTRMVRTMLPNKQRAEHILQDLFRFDFPPVAPYRTVNNHAPVSDYSFDYFWERSDGLPWDERILYLETRIWLPGDPLMKVDKMTMAHSLEARVPLLDMNVVKLANSIPAGWKRSLGADKALLKDSFKSLLPKSIFQRKKRAFELPLRSWIQNELRPFINEYITESKLAESGCLNAPHAMRFVHEHMNGNRDYAYEVWALLVYQMWYERWFKHFS